MSRIVTEKEYEEYLNLKYTLTKVKAYVKEWGNLYCLKHKQFKEYQQYKDLLKLLGD